MTASNQLSPAASNGRVVLIVAWVAVVLPLAWGVEQTMKKALALFGW